MSKQTERNPTEATNRMKALLSRFCSNEHGATAIEYALIAGIISIAIVGALHQIGPAIEANFTTASDAFNQ